MKIIYFSWKYSYDIHIIKAFEKEGITVEKVEISFPLFLNDYIFNEEKNKDMVLYNLNKEIEKKLEDKNVDIVFTINFSLLLSNYCQEKGIAYCSWVLQLPNFDLYTKSVYNTCNYICVCDSYLVERLSTLGVRKIFFLANAVENREKVIDHGFERGICYISQQPNIFMKTNTLSRYSLGYLDAFLHAQRVLLGENILENGLINRIQKELELENNIPHEIAPCFKKLFMADYYLAPVSTVHQQNIFLQNIDSILEIYSDTKFEMCNCKKSPYVNKESERRDIYSKKEFTLLLPPHTLYNGIPREFFEVVVSGGFPICSYRKDFDYFFKKEENIEYFTDYTEFKQLIVKYGNDLVLRKKLIKEMFDTINSYHTYNNRIRTMINLWYNA